MAGSFVFLQHGAKTNSEYALLGSPEGRFLDGGEGDVEVEGAQRGVAIKRHDAVLTEQRHALQILPFERGRDGPGVRSTLHRAKLFQYDLAAVGRRVGSLVVPEVQAVDAIVGEPDTALMLMVLLVLLLFGDVLHGPHPRDVRAGGGAQRVKVRLW